MSKKFDYKQFSRKLGPTTQKSTTFTPKKNQTIDKNDVTKMFKDWEAEAKKQNARFMIRYTTIYGKEYTAKSFDSNALNIQDEEEYLEGKVKEKTKFGWFENVTVTFLKDDPKALQNIFNKKK